MADQPPPSDKAKTTGTSRRALAMAIIPIALSAVGLGVLKINGIDDTHREVRAAIAKADEWKERMEREMKAFDAVAGVHAASKSRLELLARSVEASKRARLPAADVDKWKAQIAVARATLTADLGTVEAISKETTFATLTPFAAAVHQALAGEDEMWRSYLAYLGFKADPAWTAAGDEERFDGFLKGLLLCLQRNGAVGGSIYQSLEALGREKAKLDEDRIAALNKLSAAKSTLTVYSLLVLVAAAALAWAAYEVAWPHEHRKEKPKPKLIIPGQS